MKVIKLAEITRDDIHETNATQSAAALWSGATAYVVGDRVRRDGEVNAVFECILDHTNQIPEDTVAPASPAYWVRVSATNPYRAFDQRIDQPAVGLATIMQYRIKAPSTISGLALFGARAGTVKVRAYDPDVARINLASWSEKMDEHTLDGVTAGKVNTPGFDDTYAISALVETATSGPHALEAEGNHSFVSGTEYTVSVRLKEFTGTRRVSLELPPDAFTTTSGRGPRARVNLQTGTIEATENCTAGLVVEENGYGRLWVRATAIASLSRPAAYILMINGTSAAYAGSISNSVLVGGLQLNAGPLADYQWIADPGENEWGNIVYDEERITSLDVPYFDTEYLFLNMPALTGWYVVVTMLAVAPSVGEIAMGEVFTLGTSIVPLEHAFYDYSTIERDTFGNVNIVERSYAQDVKFNFFFPVANRKTITRILGDLRAKPAVWLHEAPSGRNDAIVYGHAIASPIFETTADVATMSIEAKGWV